MQSSDHLAWFEELEVRFSGLQAEFHEDRFKLPQARGWLTEAASLMEAAIPTNHTCWLDWCIFYAPIHGGNGDLWHWERLFAVFQAAHRMVRNGRLGSFVDLIRADTEGELLDQATALLEDGGLAATIIAGGALETHLRHLTSRYGLTIKGNGSISKYNDAISQARNNNQKVDVTASDSKQITYWGDVRNQAAHKPLDFKKDAKEIDLMIQGIRSFIARTT
jgi:hypothetical protein